MHKPLIILDAGIHCREWIATPVALYIIQQLVENSTNAALIENVDWAIVPNMNPDGYVHTQTTVKSHFTRIYALSIPFILESFMEKKSSSNRRSFVLWYRS